MYKLVQIIWVFAEVVSQKYVCMHAYIISFLPSFSVLGTLVNSEEFTKAFQCSKGSKMYPSDDRCVLC